MSDHGEDAFWKNRGGMSLQPTEKETKVFSSKRFREGHSSWRPISTAPREPNAVLLYSKDFEHADFNPSGVVDGYFDNELGWCAAWWDGCQDQFFTKTHLEPTHWKLKLKP